MIANHGDTKLNVFKGMTDHSQGKFIVGLLNNLITRNCTTLMLSLAIY